MRLLSRLGFLAGVPSRGGPPLLPNNRHGPIDIGTVGVSTDPFGPTDALARRLAAFFSYHVTENLSWRTF